MLTKSAPASSVIRSSIRTYVVLRPVLWLRAEEPRDGSFASVGGSEYAARFCPNLLSRTGMQGSHPLPDAKLLGIPQLAGHHTTTGRSGNCSFRRFRKFSSSDSITLQRRRSHRFPDAIILKASLVDAASLHSYPSNVKITLASSRIGSSLCCSRMQSLRQTSRWVRWYLVSAISMLFSFQNYSPCIYTI